jgi:steroid delta-isomerase-like uncharacterized protein
MSVQQNKEIVHQFIEEVFNKKDLDAIDRFVSTDAVIHGLPPQVPANREGIRPELVSSFKGFPDLHCTIDRTIAEDDLVVVFTTMSGTHLGQLEYLPLPPTGKEFSIPYIRLFRLAEGQIIEYEDLTDFYSFFRQLGLISSVF